MKNSRSFLYLLLLGLWSCAPLIRQSPWSPDPNLQRVPDTNRGNVLQPGAVSCGDWRNFIPDPADTLSIPARKLRINVHFINSRDSSNNFSPEAGRIFFRQLLDKANAQLDTNIRNWRSPDGTPVLPKRYRYVLWPQPKPGDDGIYFHYNDSLYYFVSSGKNQNNYDRKVVQRYGIGTDSILNIFIQVHPRDSLRSKTYRANGQGIALGTSLKMAGLFESKEPGTSFSSLLNHEIGHILSLPHAWSEDGCPDTQNHPNKCWTWTEEGPCRDQATNNMMDYNAYQIALTPCQIGRIHSVFHSERNPVRKCLVPEGKVLTPGHDIVVRDTLIWNGARDLRGNLLIANGGLLRLNCRVSMPAGSIILVLPGGVLELDGVKLHNAWGLPWHGVVVQSHSKTKKRGIVRELNPNTIENATLKTRLRIRYE
jgi:hypothetical protein